jgi:hypothetical protein
MRFDVKFVGNVTESCAQPLVDLALLAANDTGLTVMLAGPVATIVWVG